MEIKTLNQAIWRPGTFSARVPANGNSPVFGLDGGGRLILTNSGVTPGTLHLLVERGLKAIIPESLWPNNWYHDYSTWECAVDAKGRVTAIAETEHLVQICHWEL